MSEAGKLHTAYLSLGSNLGDRADNLERCIHLLANNIGIVSKRSGIYESEPWGYESKNFFYNLCIEVKTGCKPLDLLKHIIRIERRSGRKRSGSDYADRVIDIDLLFYDHMVMETPRLIIPHPGIPHRKFVLMPLAEIAPGFVHPVLKKPVAELLEETGDSNIPVRI